MRFLKFFVVAAVAAAVAGCGGRRGTAFSADGLDTLYKPSHASGFAILRAGGHSSILSVADPWQGAEGVSMHLFLARGGELPPEGFDGVVVDAPLKKVVCMSSSYVAFIDALGEADAIVGVSGVRYLMNEKVRERARDVGYDAHMNYELIAALKPDLVLIYGIAGENSQLTGKLCEMGVRCLYIGDYVEQSPLGKAEWLVAFGEMFDRRGEAERIFSQVRDSYGNTCGLLRGLTAGGPAFSGKRPVVMLNAPYRDVWYMPADGSYMARLVGDAGGNYVGAGFEGTQSRPVSGESAYVMALGADVWLCPGQAASMAGVVAENPRFAAVPAVRQGRVFNNNARTSAGGGSDFWESGAVRPDIVLKDMVKILHPSLLPDHELYYFMRME